MGMTARDAQRSTSLMVDAQRTPLQRARAAYLRGDIEADEYEYRVEAIYAVQAGIASKWPRPRPWDCSVNGHVHTMRTGNCRFCGTHVYDA